MALIPFLALPVLMALLLVPFALQRAVFPPRDAILAGPLDGGIVHMGAVTVALIYFLVWLGLSGWVARRREVAPAGWLARIGPVRWLSPLVLYGCAAAYVYGVGTYWYVTPQAIAVKDNLFGPARLHPWSDVTGREIGCWMSRGGTLNVHYVIRLRQDLPLDIAESQQVPFAEHFPAVLALTGSTRIIGPVDGLSRCPAYLAQYLAQYPAQYPAQNLAQHSAPR